VSVKDMLSFKNLVFQNQIFFYLRYNVKIINVLGKKEDEPVATETNPA
jgi:hypothetical protein